MSLHPRLSVSPCQLLEIFCETKHLFFFSPHHPGRDRHERCLWNGCLQALSQAVPDLIISDIGMPEIDGYMLLRHIRRLLLEQGGQIPAITLSAYAGEIDRASAIAAGFQSYLAKPIDPEMVAAIAIELVSSA